jgi:hypothetical protein
MKHWYKLHTNNQASQHSEKYIYIHICLGKLVQTQSQYLKYF